MKTLLVVAHADDETIAASRLLGTCPADCVVLHATDSAPRNPKYFGRAGCATREQYGELRQAELQAAMRIAGVSPEQCHTAPVADQEAVMHVRLLAKLISGFFPVDRVITHANEGGHPDHDATALAVALAAGCTGMEVWEFPAYHAHNGLMVAGQFIPNASNPAVETIQLNAQDSVRKKAMFSCFRSQQHLMDRFSLTQELLRRAPEYDFLTPPHAGVLYYETRDMGLTYQQWRRYAEAALGAPQ